MPSAPSLAPLLLYFTSVKNCRFCSNANHDSAARCRDCGAEFVDGQSAPETTSESGELTNASLEPQSFNASRRCPAEYWMLLGVGLSAAGYAYLVVAVILLYLLFKNLRPRAEWELLLLASGLAGVNLFKTFHLLSAHQSPIHFLEPFLVTNAAVTLLCTRQRGWARLLLVYSLIAMLGEPLWAFLSDPIGFHVRDNLFTMVVLGLAAWLITRWMARQKLVNDSTNATSIFVLRKT